MPSKEREREVMCRTVELECGAAAAQESSYDGYEELIK